MATRVSDGNVQAMQQFIGQSPWQWESLRKASAHRLVGALQLVAFIAWWAILFTGKSLGVYSTSLLVIYAG